MSKVVALAGGVGAARFLSGLVGCVAPEEITVIGNTGDDLVFHGLHICPDLDIVTYTLAGVVDPAKGWGRAGDSFRVLGELEALGAEVWFSLGDLDLAVSLYRTARLARGRRLSEVTAEIARRFGLEVRILPMTDDPVGTVVRVRSEAGEEELGFQEYWVKRGARDPVLAVRLAGGESATPAPGVKEAISGAEAVLICPSNPVVSVGSILSVPGIREALRHTAAPVVAVSPLVGGKPLRGMADTLMEGLGLKVRAAEVARLYSDFLDGFVLDPADEGEAEEVAGMGIRPLVFPAVMKDREAAVSLARATLDLAFSLRPRRPKGAGAE